MPVREAVAIPQPRGDDARPLDSFNVAARTLAIAFARIFTVADPIRLLPRNAMAEAVRLEYRSSVGEYVSTFWMAVSVGGRSIPLIDDRRASGNAASLPGVKAWRRFLARRDSPKRPRDEAPLAPTQFAQISLYRFAMPSQNLQPAQWLSVMSPVFDS